MAIHVGLIYLATHDKGIKNQSSVNSFVSLLGSESLAMVLVINIKWPYVLQARETGCVKISPSALMRLTGPQNNDQSSPD